MPDSPVETTFVSLELKQYFFIIKDDKTYFILYTFFESMYDRWSLLDRFVYLLFDKVDRPQFAPFKILFFGGWRTPRDLNLI